MKYAVCLNQESRFAPTIIGEFILQQKEGLHVWKGKFATSMKEMADQVNEAVQFMPTFADPFMTLRVVEIEAEEELIDLSVEEPLTEQDFAGVPPDEQPFAGQPFEEQPTAPIPIKLRKLKMVGI